jgi:thimet oligopeptidase
LPQAPGCASACSSPTTPAPIPVNQQILLDLLATRQEIATVLGFRSWADLATADQMMGSAANVRTFLAKLE